MSCCNDPVITPVPGPAGADGLNAFSLTTAAFLQPLVGSTVSVSVLDASWMVPGQTIFVQVAGYMGVSSVDSPTSVTLVNTGAAGNAAPATNIPSGSGVTPGGVQGPTGTLNSLSPTTAKGDLIIDSGAGGGSASDVRFASGSNGTVLHCDSTKTNGREDRGVDLAGVATTLLNTLPIAKGGTGQSTQQTALNNLMPPGAVKGDLTYYDGTNWNRLPAAATAHMLLRASAGANPQNPEWAFQGLLQKIVKLFAASSGTNTASGVAFGSTAPTSTDGALALSQAVTPLSAASALRVNVNMTITTTAGAFMALFNGSTLLAVVATNIVGTQQIHLLHEFSPGSISALTLNVRIGTNASGTVYIGGTAANGANFYGATTNLGALTVEELIGA